MLKEIKHALRKDRLSMAREMAEYIKLSTKHGLDLNLVQDNLRGIDKKDIILFSTFRNEKIRLKFFIEYYRNLGVKHFIFVDNDSDDGCMELLSEYSDVSVFYTKSSYKDSNFGMHWMNYLLRQYGTGKWCVTCDPDEFLVFPHIESRDLVDLTEMLDRNKRKAFFTLMIDMYGKGQVESQAYIEGKNPLDTCSYFDSYGYVSRDRGHYKNLWAQGGVRSRVFSKNEPKKSPAINKTPLVKWDWNYSYISSMHMLIPAYLNTYYHSERATVTGCLLHFKFISTLKQKVEEEISRKQHYNDSAEYKLYKESLENELALYNDEISVQYKGWQQLASLGLLRNGSWG